MNSWNEWLRAQTPVTVQIISMALMMAWTGCRKEPAHRDYYTRAESKKTGTTRCSTRRQTCGC